MTGIGGGSLMTPLLILVFGVNPITAVGTDLAYGAVTKTVGGYKHWLQKTVDLRCAHGWRWVRCPRRSAAFTCWMCCRASTGAVSTTCC